MINLYFKNFNFNLSNSIGLLLSSESEKENFIKRIDGLKLGWEAHSFLDLKTLLALNRKIVSPLEFPLKNIYSLLTEKIIILEDISVNCLQDAVILNALLDYFLGGGRGGGGDAAITCVIVAAGGYLNNCVFAPYKNYDYDNDNDNDSDSEDKVSSYESMILKIYKTRLKLFTETRIITDSKYGGYTSSMFSFIGAMNNLGFHLTVTDKDFIFTDDKNSSVGINLKNFREITDFKCETISKNSISLNADLFGIYFHSGELINKIKIFLKIAPNIKNRVNCIFGKPEMKDKNVEEMSEIQNISLRETSLPHLIIAGAGAGKTRIIVNKFLYLLNFIPAGSILVLTFTNNAVKEIKTRVESSLAAKTGWNGLSGNNKILNISTYHGFFYSLVKEFYRQLGYESPPRIKESGSYSAAESEKNSFISFDDIILNVLKLFEDINIAKIIASRFKYILIDEYQDLDFFSDYIIKMIAFGRGCIMYAGDDDQSIYGFNGGDSFNLLFFDLFFPGGKVFAFQNNYRSDNKIINFCNSVLSRLDFRYPKKLIAKKTAAEKETGESNAVNIIKFQNRLEEEEFIKEKCEALNSRGKSTAVLVRTQKEENRYKSILSVSGKNYGYIGTIHKSKGMEFDIVFIANASRGNIPHLTHLKNRTLKHPFIGFLKKGSKINPFSSDEIKLFYVAVSRAKEKVFISYSGEISEFLKL
jgi:hypothetical protein